MTCFRGWQQDVLMGRGTQGQLPMDARAMESPLPGSVLAVLGGCRCRDCRGPSRTKHLARSPGRQAGPHQSAPCTPASVPARPASRAGHFAPSLTLVCPIPRKIQAGSWSWAASSDQVL